MRIAFPRIAVLAIVIAWSIPATAHHSRNFFFDISKSITLEGEIQRVEWINPHILVFLQSKNDKGELETWILEGASPHNASRQEGLKERLKPGISISARVHPHRIPLLLKDGLTVWPRPVEDTEESSHIVEGGQIRFPDGYVQTIGGGPAF